MYRHGRPPQGVDDMAWKAHWVKVGFAALETMLSSSESGAFCHADVPSMADCCLIPQVSSIHDILLSEPFLLCIAPDQGLGA